jgi:hypothetical protein
MTTHITDSGLNYRGDHSTMPNNLLDIAEIDDQIAAKRENLRELVEQAAAYSGAADDDLREIQLKIGQQLRASYNEVVVHGVPDRFVDLIRRLENEPGQGRAGRQGRVA